MDQGDKSDITLHEELTAELEELGNRLVHRAFQRVDRKGPLAIPRLRELASTLFVEEWEHDPTAALIALIKEGAAKLREQLLDTPITWAQIAHTAFNLSGQDLSHVAGRKYDHLLKSAFSVANLPKDSRRNQARKLREKLAAALIALSHNEDQPVSTPAVNHGSESPVLIDRPEYLDQLCMIASLGKPVVIWGEAGTGKSVLARAASQRIGGRLAVIVRLGDSRVLQNDIVEALIVAGMDPASWTENYCVVQFRRTLASVECPIKVVVLDDVYDEDSAWDLIPPGCKIPILITSRKKPATNRFDRLELHEFTPNQASEFLHRCLGEISEADFSALTRLLGRRPLALYHAASYIKGTAGIQCSDLVLALAENVAATLELIALPALQEKNLVRLYEKILSTILMDNSAQDVLDYFLSLTGRNGATTKEFLNFFLGHVFPGRTEKIRIATGIRILSDYGLIRSDANTWKMHTLTLSILRQLRVSVASHFDARFIQTLVNKEIEPQYDHDDFSVAGQRQARILQMELRAGSNIIEGWENLLCIDVKTWIAVRRYGGAGEPGRTETVRYEILRSGIYKFDYATGNLVRLFRQEDLEFRRAVKLYNVLSDATVLKRGLTGFTGSDFDQLASYVAAGDNGPLARVASRSKTVNFDRSHLAYQILAVDRVNALSEEFHENARRMLVNIIKHSYPDSFPPFEEMQTFTSWLLDSGHVTSALDWLDDMNDRATFDADYERAEIGLQKARGYLALGDWSAVEDELARCAHYYSIVEDPLESLRGVRIVQSLTVDLLRMKGADSSGLISLRDAVPGALIGQREGVKDAISEVRTDRILANISVALFARTAYGDESILADFERVNIEELLDACHSLEDTHLRSTNIFRSRLEREQICYDLDHASALAGRLSYQELFDRLLPLDGTMLAHGKRVPRRIDVQCDYRRYLLAYKLALVDPQEDPSEWDCEHVRFLMQVVSVFAEYESAYWHCETVAVLYAASAWLGLPHSGLQVAVQEGFEHIGRSDRWQCMQEALSFLPSEPIKFKESLSYLLTW